MWHRRVQGGRPVAAVLGLLCVMAGCQDRNVGLPPPDRQLFFPAGLYVDHTITVPDGDDDPTNDAPRYLMVANGNNDLRFNAGTLVAIDLQRFFDAWFDPALGGVRPYCETGGDLDHCVEPPGGPTTSTRPCRRLALKPQVVECNETAFIEEDHIVHLGDFATSITASQEDGFTRLWIPIRGDPSITYVDAKTVGGRLELDCHQGRDPDEPDPKVCGDDHRLRYIRNDPDLRELAREPFNMLITERGGERLAFVAHADGSDMTLIDLDGVRGGDRPAIVDRAPAYISDSGAQLGGFGFAERPCFQTGEGPLGAADPLSNVPSLTEDCTRPLVYSSFRFAPYLLSLTASGLKLPATSSVVDPLQRTDCFVDAPTQCDGTLEGCDVTTVDCAANPGQCERVYAGQYCATPDQLGQPCAVLCEPRLRGRRRILPGGLYPSTSGAVLGDIAFADPRGDRLLVLETNPGALLVIDTSLGDDGEPLDQPSAPPIEICAEPSRMTTWDGGGQRYALISCFAAALVYVVDLDARQVVDNIVVGTGPNELVVDQQREMLYVANTLEASISVIDLSRERDSRFQEVARIGLQEPFER